MSKALTNVCASDIKWNEKLFFKHGSNQYFSTNTNIGVSIQQQYIYWYGDALANAYDV
jgi:hypothetical protein